MTTRSSATATTRNCWPVRLLICSPAAPRACIAPSPSKTSSTRWERAIPVCPCCTIFPRICARFPRSREQGIFTDLAATDILRDRERGVPRYCAFRRTLRMSVPKSFAELTENAQWQRELETIYGDVERVDLLTGTLAETKPPGFAISDTTFRIFIVIAGRRIKSDRVLTDDYTPD